MSAPAPHPESIILPASAGVTTWARLHLDTSDPLLVRAHQVQVHDALWFLARQWQTGELAGFDGGSPMTAAYQLQQSVLNAYQPTPSTATTAAAVKTLAPGDPPLEVRIEREAFPLGLRGSVQLGLRFEATVRDALGASAASFIQQFRAVCAISATAPAAEIPDPKAQAFRRTVAGRVTDGVLLYRTATGQATGVTLPGGAPAAVASFVAWCNGLYSLPGDAGAWDRNALAFELAAAAAVPAPGISAGVAAPDFPGGQLDWYSFDYTTPAIAGGSTPPALSNATVIPSRIAIPGARGPTFWEFDDARTDLGSLDIQTVDLPKMLLADFAAVAASNWFSFSILAPVGSLNRLAGIAVTDSFGCQTLVPPTGELDPPKGAQKAWQMFTLAGDATRRDTLLLPPALGRVMDGPVLEDVLFFRDDMAAMAWAVERSLDGPLDVAVSGFESQLTAPTAAAPLPAGADVNWLLGTTVPRNWIPLLPYTAADQSLMLRRGGMYDPTSSATPPLVPARGVVLTPREMFVVRDQAVGRAGVQVSRYVRRARWLNGATYCWMARRTRAGKGQGSSGLAFDVLAGPPAA
jgi:hypothetical protein